MQAALDFRGASLRAPAPVIQLRRWAVENNRLGILDTPEAIAAQWERAQRLMAR